MTFSGADAAGARRLARVQSIAVCPTCRGELAWSADEARCGDCGAAFPIRNGRIYFVAVPQRDDDLDRVKGWLKRTFGRAYYTIGVRLLAPTFPFNFARFVTRRVDPAAGIVIDAGCGNHRLHEDIIGADLFDYDAVDVVCSLGALPFRDNAVAAIVTRSVLEHVPAPHAVVSEFRRCTRAGGLNMHLIPFLFPEHASPDDFHRFTVHGQDVLFAGWDLVERTNPGGPVSAALSHFIDVLATVLSANVTAIKSVVYLALCGLFFPLKFLDAPFVNRGAFLGSSATILSVVRKQG